MSSMISDKPEFRNLPKEWLITSSAKLKPAPSAGENFIFIMLCSFYLFSEIFTQSKIKNL